MKVSLKVISICCSHVIKLSLKILILTGLGKKEWKIVWTVHVLVLVSRQCWKFLKSTITPTQSRSSTYDVYRLTYLTLRSLLFWFYLSYLLKIELLIFQWQKQLLLLDANHANMATAVAIRIDDVQLSFMYWLKIAKVERWRWSRVWSFDVNSNF